MEPRPPNGALRRDSDAGSLARVVAVGLGPAGPGLITADTGRAIGTTSPRFLRTRRHPAASAVPAARSFDHLYDTSSSFEELYGAMVEVLVDAARQHGRVLFAVPGSPWVAERAVERLGTDPRVALETHAGLSFADLAWDRLGVDPLAAGVRLVDGRRFAVEAAGERGPLLVGQCDRPQVLSDIKLALDGPGPAVVVLQHLGLADESVRTVAWDALDRLVEPDHLTSLYVPELATPVAAELARFGELVRELRQRCPWDREQTHQSLTSHLLEEAGEVVEAIEALDGSAGRYAALEEELGDLLFQVFIHSTLAAEEGAFTLADVARGIHDKLVRRHPHVFGDARAETAADVVSLWARIKEAEKGVQ